MAVESWLAEREPSERLSTDARLAAVCAADSECACDITCARAEESCAVLELGEETKDLDADSKPE